MNAAGCVLPASFITYIKDTPSSDNSKSFFGPYQKIIDKSFPSCVNVAEPYFRTYAQYTQKWPS
jgi:hypothetical protein